MGGEKKEREFAVACLPYTRINESIIKPYTLRIRFCLIEKKKETVRQKEKNE